MSIEDYELVKDDSLIKERYADTFVYLGDTEPPMAYSYSVKKGVFFKVIGDSVVHEFFTYEVLDELMTNLFTPLDITERLYNYPY